MYDAQETPDNLPLAISTPTLAEILGVDDTTVRTAAKEGGITVGESTIIPIISAARVAWPTIPVFEALGLGHDHTTAARAVSNAMSTRRAANAAKRDRLSRTRETAE